ncbi:MAG: hypothetical protein K8U57_14160 [Planctomycetes bacterium]|nr:hypothetical protein [Planctomycetota bacterium]
MSQFKYGTVQLALLRTLLFRIDTETDPSGSDRKWNRYEVKVRGILTSILPEPVVPPADEFTSPSQKQPPKQPLSDMPLELPDSGDSAAFMAKVKHMMMTPRLPLIYQVGDTKLLEVSNPPDAAFGPEPLSCEVRQVNAGGTWLVEWGGIVRLVDCDNNPLSQSPIVSLRWSQNEIFDENWYSRLVTSGKLIVRTDLFKVSADFLRPLTVPNVLNDYVRTESSYTLNPNGSELDFRFVDQEKNLMPPIRATKASGRFTIVCPKPGVNRVGQVDIRLEGPKGTSRNALMVIAMRIAFAKLEAEKFFGATRMIWGTFREELWECVVEVSMQAMLREVKPKEDLDMMRSGGITPGCDPGRPGLSPPVRARILALLTAAFRDPCNPKGVDLLSNGKDAPTSAVTMNGGPVVSLVVADTKPDTGEPSIKDEAPYESYLIDTTYAYDAGYAQLPGTGVGPKGGESCFVRRHGGLATMTVSWSASRIGFPPVLPKFASPNSNFQHMHMSLEIGGSEFAADAQNPTYKAAGTYHYGVKNPILVSAAAPIPPFLTDAAAPASKDTAGYFSDDIIWKFQGQGPCPWNEQLTVGQKPNDNVAKSLGANLPGGPIPTSDIQSGDGPTPPPPVA